MSDKYINLVRENDPDQFKKIFQSTFFRTWSTVSEKKSKLQFYRLICIHALRMNHEILETLLTSKEEKKLFKLGDFDKIVSRLFNFGGQHQVFIEEFFDKYGDLFNYSSYNKFLFILIKKPFDCNWKRFRHMYINRIATEKIPLEVFHNIVSKSQWDFLYDILSHQKNFEKNPFMVFENFSSCKDVITYFETIGFINVKNDSQYFTFYVIIIVPLFENQKIDIDEFLIFERLVRT